MRRRMTGAVLVRTVVAEDVQHIDTPVDVETVEVERMPVDRWVEAPVPDRQEGNTTIISLHEEVVVTRLKLVEEIRITRRQTTRQVGHDVVLRREKVHVERLGVGDPAPPEDDDAG